ncbi:MAG: hypothetical protein A2445_05325 [Candidatus Jacksonbacteria bacterium RIFOXYC2_FULL_44_29]|nr:MAG: hypothetical protein UW45_C0030G0005 [Parcubacteria group bacterium GW2011_GWC2_44_22]OGY76183.1 MAG: hypothetical protein A2240_04825 [Candidatus Jacksonbacteria bacterium RIFOXYA2_FULL_43_12]OGY77901.1 MAG: hypothetical protein A2295_04495 [Candidatus Jacksonbacteria bacterium RIFOXYB2_FULL_44_15]OGY78717.1 MAG: hypothetical protein A2550_04345 [Candidatus Jacksonbacteria bacterium RIFOXYD2_FULL_43_21]OGY80271.1 MAG: hypothetical protein A2445_05325 [Candidatus Jacksonbacteria bacteri
MKDELLKNKSILLDTNILIAYSKYTNHLDPFFSYLTKHDSIPYITDAISFEFLRYSCTGGEFKKLEGWLLAQDMPMIHSKPEDVETATKLSVMYANKRMADKKQVSFVDMLNAAQLIRYKDEIVLMTTDIHDYPLGIFDRIGVQAIDVVDQVLTVAFIRYNEQKYKKCRLDVDI